MVYTAPVFSDHIAVTALLKVDLQRRGVARVDGEWNVRGDDGDHGMSSDVQACKRLHEAQSHKEGRRPPKGNQDIAKFFQTMTTNQRVNGGKEELCVNATTKDKISKPTGIRRWLKTADSKGSSTGDDSSSGEPMKKKPRL